LRSLAADLPLSAAFGLSLALFLARLGRIALGSGGPAVEIAIEIPAGDAAIGAPRLGKRHEPLRLGRALEAVEIGHRHADREIAQRQYVEASQHEDQVHVGGPAADALDGGE